jgi:hypothetical protein
LLVEMIHSLETLQIIAVASSLSLSGRPFFRTAQQSFVVLWLIWVTVIRAPTNSDLNQGHLVVNKMINVGL